MTSEEASFFGSEQEFTCVCARKGHIQRLIDYVLSDGKTQPYNPLDGMFHIKNLSRREMTENLLPEHGEKVDVDVLYETLISILERKVHAKRILTGYYEAEA